MSVKREGGESTKHRKPTINRTKITMEPESAKGKKRDRPVKTKLRTRNTKVKGGKKDE